MELKWLDRMEEQILGEKNVWELRDWFIETIFLVKF